MENNIDLCGTCINEWATCPVIFSDVTLDEGNIIACKKYKVNPLCKLEDVTELHESLGDLFGKEPRDQRKLCGCCSKVK